MDLNVRIQKSLILDFDLASAKQSALEDWKIDIERELMDGPIIEKEGEGDEDGRTGLRGRAKDRSGGLKNQNQELEGIKETEDEEGAQQQKSSAPNKNSGELVNSSDAEDGAGGQDGQALFEEDSILKDGPDTVEYERLSEFFFDLCLSWCQHLDIETYIFFLNGIFLNITAGSHVNVSVFKEIEEIEVLSVEFFNRLLAYRNKCEENLQKGLTYAEWYA